MKIEAQHTKDVEVEISDFTAKKIAADIIRKVMKLPINPSIEKDKLVHNYLEEWGHKSEWEQKIIRPASEEDKAAVLILNEVEAW